MVWTCWQPWLTVVGALLLLLSPEAGARRRRNGLTSPLQAPYHSHSSDQLLPRDTQISTFLTARTPKTFFYWADGESSLSITIIPCLSELRWSLRHRYKNDTTPAKPTEPILQEFTSRSQRTEELPNPAKGGLYVLQLEATERDSWSHVYISTEPGGPQALRRENLNSRIRINNRQGRRKVTVKWDQSLVDPHVTDYYLVVSQRQNYFTLCQAMEEKYGPRPPEDNNLQIHRPMSMLKLMNHNESIHEPIINFVGPQTYYTISNMKHGETYYISLFAINRQTNLSYSYGHVQAKVNSKVKPKSLRDGKSSYVNLKKYDGKTVLRYKVGWRNKSPEPLQIYVIPCGGAVDVEVLLKGVPVIAKHRVEGYRRHVIKNPEPGNRYYIRIYSSNREELTRTSSVEVLATMKKIRSPVPSIPTNNIVKEYTSMRKCDSITIGWLPTSDRWPIQYCIFVREGHLREMEDYRPPNQCGLENRLKKSTDFAFRSCEEIKRGKKIMLNKDKVITKTINHLKPGQSYVVQVTARKKSKGKPLSYKLIQVHTMPMCQYS